MSDTATFCATCGALVLTDATSAAEEPPVSAAVDSLPLDDRQAPQAFDVARAPKPAAFSSRGARIAIVLTVAALLILIFGVLAGTSLHHSIPGTPVTLSDYNLLALGLNVEQVEAILSDGTGATQTQNTTSATGGIVYRWTNPDGSYVTVVFVNGVVSSMSQSGLSESGLQRTGGTGGRLFTLTRLALSVFNFVTMGVCLYLATLLVGYNITVKQIVAIAAICGLVSAVPYVGWLLSLVVGFTLLQKWTEAELVDTVVILVVAGVLGVLVAIPFGLGIGLGFHL